MRRLVLESLYRGETDQPPKVANSDEEALKVVSGTANGGPRLGPRERPRVDS